MVIDSFQKRFVMYMQLWQCFSRAKPFRQKKSQKKRKVFKKRQNFKIWLQKSQIGNPAIACDLL